MYDWLERHRRRYEIEVVSRPRGETAFKPVKIRWVVERTLAWLGKYPCLSEDYEHLPTSIDAVIHPMLKRLVDTALQPVHKVSLLDQFEYWPGARMDTPAATTMATRDGRESSTSPN